MVTVDLVAVRSIADAVSAGAAMANVRPRIAQKGNGLRRVIVVSSTDFAGAKDAARRTAAMARDTDAYHPIAGHAVKWLTIERSRSGFPTSRPQPLARRADCNAVGDGAGDATTLAGVPESDRVAMTETILRRRIDARL
jgi:hypothetical protein